MRPHAGGVEALLASIDRQRAAGYRLAGSFETDQPDNRGSRDAAAVAGFRLGECLSWGKYLYVEDLVTRPEARGRGHAAALLSWLELQAREHGCEQLHLDSDVGPDRADAHRFYLKHRFRISSHHFARPVDIVLVD